MYYTKKLKLEVEAAVPGSIYAKILYCLLIMEPEEEQTTQEEKPSDKESQVESDPKKFMDGFMKSRWYKDAYKDFFKGKEIDASATEKERRGAFLNDDKAKFALVDYGTKDVYLKYSPNFYGQKSRESINNYIGLVKDMARIIREGANDNQILIIDQQRYDYHETVGKHLVEDGIVPTEKLGRAFARLILIDKKLDTPTAAREPDINRIKRKLGII